MGLVFNLRHSFVSYVLFLGMILYQTLDIVFTTNNSWFLTHDEPETKSILQFPLSLCACMCTN